MKPRARSNRLSRRSFIRQAALASVIAKGGMVSAQGTLKPMPIPLGGGLEVRDYRIFPTPDVRRFIVEVYNATETLMETPTVGVVWHQSPEKQNFGIAVPGSSILYPRSSGVLIGVAPDGLDSDEKWGRSEWMFCDDEGPYQSEDFKAADLELSFNLKVADENRILVDTRVVNRTTSLIYEFVVTGIVYDKFGRVCGGIRPWERVWHAPGESRDYSIEVSREMDYALNPFSLLDSAAEVNVELSVQPLHRYQPVHCPVVMPWNR